MRVYPDKAQDQEFKTLGDQGFSGSLNDRQYGYLGSLGYTGALPDRFHRFKKSFLADLYESGASFLYFGGFNPSQTRMFEQSDKTGEVTGAGQPVGIVLGSGPLLQAVQATALSRPALARWPKGGRRNLLTWTEGLTNAAWIKNQVTVELETDDFWRVTRTGGSSTSVSQNIGNVPNGVTYTATIDLMAGSLSSVDFGLYRGQWTAAGTTVEVLSGPGAALNNNGWARISGLSPTEATRVRLTKTTSPDDPRTDLQILVYPGNIGSTLGGVLIRRPQLEFGPTATPYQRVTTQYDVTEQGVEDVWFLYNDGNDLLLSTVPAGTYEIAYLSPSGLPQYVSQTLSSAGTLNVLRADRLVDVVVKQGSFTSDEKRKLEQEWERYVL